jgi:hypothetical protein
VEGHRGGAEADHVAVGQATGGAQALAVDERAVARAVVGHRPALLGPLEPAVEARDLLVPVEREVRRAPAPDRRPRHARLEGEDLLPALAVRVEEERMARALGLAASVGLGGGLGTGRGVGGHAAHYRR